MGSGINSAWSYVWVPKGDHDSDKRRNEWLQLHEIMFSISPCVLRQWARGTEGRTRQHAFLVRSDFSVNCFMGPVPVFRAGCIRDKACNVHMRRRTQTSAYIYTISKLSEPLLRHPKRTKTCQQSLLWICLKATSILPPPETLHIHTQKDTT